MSIHAGWLTQLLCVFDYGISSVENQRAITVCKKYRLMPFWLPANDILQLLLFLFKYIFKMSIHDLKAMKSDLGCKSIDA